MTSIETEPTPNISVETELPHMDYAERLRDIFTLDQELIDELRPQLWTVAERVCGLVIDPVQRSAITAYANVVDWSLFGQPGDQLPRGAVMTINDKGELEYSLDHRIPYLRGSADMTLGAEFARLDLAGVTDVIYRKITDEKIRPILQSVIHESAEYQMLMSFSQRNQSPNQSPLSPFWRAIRENQIEADVRQRFGIGPGEDISRGSEADWELRRKVFGLDDETRMDRSDLDENYDSLRRARAYLLPYITRWLDPDETITDITYGDGVEVHTNKTTEYGYEIYDFSEKVAADISGELYVGPENIRFIAMDFVDCAVTKIMDPRATSLEDAIEEAVIDSSGYVIDKFKDLVRTSYGVFSARDSDPITLIKQPKGELVGRKPWEFDGPSFHKTFRSVSSIMSASDIVWEKRRRLGRVDKYGPDNFRVPTRLMIEQTYEQKPEVSGDEDLIINIFGAQSQYIPGYVLVSRSDSRQGFVVDRNGDPYRACNVVINKERRTKLVSHYHAAGLEGLAEKVSEANRLTVEKLAILVRSETDYYAPDQNLDGESYLNTVDHIQKCVIDGRLKLQCTGSAAVLSLSLNSIFGNGSANTVHGKTISSDNLVINGAGHAQTLFQHKGKLYILDATAEAKLGDDFRVPPSGGGTNHEQKTANAPKIEKADHLDFDSKMIDTKVEKTKEQMLDEEVSSLVESLRVALDLPNNEQLFKHLVKLPKSDPIRVTVEIMFQLRNGKITFEQFNEKGEYVEKCAEVDHEMKKKMGFENYSQYLLENLRSAVWRTQRSQRTSEDQPKML